MFQFCAREWFSTRKNDRALTLEGEGFGIELPEVGNQPALAMEINRKPVWLTPPAVNPDGAAAAAFGCEETELAPTQGLQERAYVPQAFGLIENEFADFGQPGTNCWREGCRGVFEKPVIFAFAAHSLAATY